jgi:hypothetical protein
MINPQGIVFGQNRNQTHHTFRYTDALGLDRGNVMDAIREDLQPNLPLQTPPPNNAPFIGKVTVTDIELSYNAYPVSEGVVNVGRIIGR